VSNETETVTCAFCGATTPDVETAVDAGWEPGFYTGDQYLTGPVCGQCSAEHLSFDDEAGEMVAKPGHETFLRSNQETVQ
jgi:hypothetical protein